MASFPDDGSFAGRIVRWQRVHGRHDLPWHGARDPYRIWVSEIMLQQTQVVAVVPYYERFVRRFPGVDALARAGADEVMAAWAGLGYYSRARNLHRCARTVVERHGGRFPRSVAELAALPGIGRSTAAAIAAFAFGTRAAILDGNVRRVMSRQFGIEGDPGSSAVQRRLWAAAEQALPAADIETYTQGLMDLGATLCTRARPRCDDCPVNSGCVARAEQRTADLPTPRPTKTRPLRHATVAIIRDDAGALLLEARPPSGIWGGLMSLPEFDPTADDEQLAAAIANRFALQVALRERLPALRHDFSHYSLVMHPRIATIRRAVGAAGPAARLVGRDALDNTPLPAPVRRLLAGLGD